VTVDAQKRPKLGAAIVCVGHFSHVTATVTHPSGNLGLHDAARQIDDHVSIRRHIHVVDSPDSSTVAFLKIETGT
jgi:hypothetical protein